MIFRVGRTLPRVRELKRSLKFAVRGSRKGRTLPRVRELKQRGEHCPEECKESHPSQGA